MLESTPLIERNREMFENRRQNGGKNRNFSKCCDFQKVTTLKPGYLV